MKKTNRRAVACIASASITLIVASSAPAAYTWNVTSPTQNATVQWSSIPCNLTLGWVQGTDPIPTQIIGILEVNGVEYQSTN